MTVNKTNSLSENTRNWLHELKFIFTEYSRTFVK